MHLANYLGLLDHAETSLAAAFRMVADHHGDEPDIGGLCRTFSAQCAHHAERVAPFADRYGEEGEEEPERLRQDLFGGTRSGGLGLLRDLHDLYLMATAADIAWDMVRQAAQGARDRALLDTVTACEKETASQLRWLRSRMEQAAPQTLLVAR